MKKFSFKKNVWFSDEEYLIEFPDNWDVTIYGDQPLPALSDIDIEEKLNHPIGCASIPFLANNKKTAAIAIDDLSRPTPVTVILTKVIAQLKSVGIDEKNIILLIATGTHKVFSSEDILRKIDKLDFKEIKVIQHNCREDCVLIGHTDEGTPITINKKFLESDVKISVGSVYPHPIAGFSGGNKMAVVGLGGYETIRILHDLRSGTRTRSGSIEHPFRWEINKIAERIGIDFCINLVLNQNREICNMFAGHPEKAFVEAVDFVKSAFSVPLQKDADLIISDIYPFDMDLQFGFDRGIWPFEHVKKATQKVLLANCARGIGGHDLFPVSNPIQSRITRRIVNFQLKDLTQIGSRLQSIRNILWRRSLHVIVVSPNISESELKTVLPKGQIVMNWQDALDKLVKLQTNKTNVKVVIYKASPLLLANFQDGTI